MFTASVIWLIFDMAALRLSISDVNSQLLKERVIRERELYKEQAKVSQVINQGIGHPVQRVNLGVTEANNELLNSDKLAQVYRHGGKKREQDFGDKKSEP